MMDVPYIIRWDARNESHEEFLKCAGTDTEYLVPWSDRSSPLILQNLQKCENYALSKKWLPPRPISMNKNLREKIFSLI